MAVRTRHLAEMAAEIAKAAGLDLRQGYCQIKRDPTKDRDVAQAMDYAVMNALDGLSRGEHPTSWVDEYRMAQENA